jgi:ferric-dicitrate binding protein FerR (iron transport regulator)
VSSRSSIEGPTDPTAEQVADFVSAQVGPSAPANSGEREFVQRLASFRRNRRNRKRFAVGVTIATTLVMGGLVGFRHRGEAPAVPVLSYRVDDQEPPSSGYILVAQTAESLLAFSDGSKVRMAPRARGRVVEVNSRGARFALDDGKVSVDVVQRPRAQWIFEAGPFRVNVHGTSFTVVWNPLEAIFEVRLISGAISVVSPVAGPEIQMHAGQSLKVSLRDQEITMGTTSARESPPATDGALASTSIEPPRTVPAGPAEATRWSHRGWLAALSENKAAAVVADADRRGLTAVLERADSEDLWALANAARYATRYPLARQALSAHRRRFPSSERSREAAFLLGRLHEGDTGGPAEALGWYDRYLAEADSGVGISDALGRKMTLLERWNRHTEALTAARDYLRRFPRGTYANAARALVRSSTTGQ